MPIARSRHQRQVDLVNKNRNYSGPRAVGHSGEDKTGTSRGRSRQESSPRRRGRCGAEASVERVGVSGGRRVRQFRVSGRHYADMPGIRRNKLTPKAEEVYEMLSKKFMVDFDEAGTIGKRYRRQDEIGTPFCITVDFDTIEKDNCVTVRDRDTMEQVRVSLDELEEFIEAKIAF